MRRGCDARYIWNLRWGLFFYGFPKFGGGYYDPVIESDSSSFFGYAEDGRSGIGDECPQCGGG